jgi:hypothetical protein
MVNEIWSHNHPNVGQESASQQWAGLSDKYAGGVH